MSYPTPPAAGDQVTADIFNDFTLNPKYTFGETIDAGEALYLKQSDGKAYLADADLQESVDQFIGFAAEAGLADETKYVVPPGKVITGLSSLTTGAKYYLQNTAGSIGLTPGTLRFQVGFAISTTALLILPGKDLPFGIYGDGSDGHLAVTSGTTTLTTDKIYQYKSLDIDAGATLDVGSSAAGKPLVILVQGDVTIDGTIDLQGEGSAGGAGVAGSAGGAGTAGVGLFGGGAGGGGGESSTGVANGNNGSNASGKTGGAGGTGAAGGDGGVGGAGNSNLLTTALLLLKSNIWSWAFGGGGGAGGGATVSTSFAGAAGGAGGGALIIIANGDVTIGAAGVINCSGNDGSNGSNNGFAGGNGGGGGGGGGGTCLILHGGSFTNSGSIDVSGGAGGTGASVGMTAGNGGNGSAGTSTQIEIGSA